MKNLFLTIIAFGLLLTSCQKDSLTTSRTRLDTENREKHGICIETYNTYLLDSPDLFSEIDIPPFGIYVNTPQCEGDDCLRRATAICNRVTANGADILNLQEVWIGGEARKTLIDCLKSKGYTILEDAGCNGGGWVNEDNDCTGLLTATKLKVVSTEIEFFNCETGYDKYKEKDFN
ncbi:MAG: hypothetical protein IPO92_18070 [Saprospiraceae bacterium]|nr:hypothetical protein [Saprospiraceae bacterium]